MKCPKLPPLMRRVAGHLWWALPVLVALVLMPMSSVRTTSDSAWYLAMATKIEVEGSYANANGEPILNRGPIFPALLAANMAVFGHSVAAAFWVIRIFYVLMVVAVLLLGRRLFGRGAAMLAALLVLSSSTIAESSARLLLDGVFPVFVLAGLFVALAALKRGKLWIWAAGGTLMALAFLTKELALLYLPYPAIVWVLVKEYRTRRNAFGLLLYLAAYAGVLLPWAIHVLIQSGSLARLIGGGGPHMLNAFADGSAGGGFFSLVGRSLTWIGDYYEVFIKESFILAPFLVFAWAYTAVRGFALRSAGATSLFVAGVLFLPMLAFQGGVGWRVGQGILFFVLSLMAAAYAVTDLWLAAVPWLARRWRERVWMRWATIGLAAASALTVLAIHVNDDRLELDELIDRTLAVYAGEPWTTAGWHTYQLEQAGAWIRENVSADAAILGDWYWLDSFAFYAGKHRFHALPYVVFPRRNAPLRQSGISPVGTDPEVPLFLWVNRGDPSPDGFLHALREGDLLRRIEQLDAEYVITTIRRGFLCRYFSTHPGFTLAANWEDVQIYRVDLPREHPGFDMRVGASLARFLRNLAYEDPDLLVGMQEEYFEALSLGPDQIRSIMSGAVPIVEVLERYCEEGS